MVSGSRAEEATGASEGYSAQQPKILGKKRRQMDLPNGLGPRGDYVTIVTCVAGVTAFAGANGEREGSSKREAHVIVSTCAVRLWRACAHMHTK